MAAEGTSDGLLRVLVEGTAGETGLPFFRALVKGMTEALQIEGAWITEFLPEQKHLRSLAFRLRDGWVDEYEYHVDGTPCGAALRQRDVIFVTDGVLDVFPEEHDLRKLNAVSYIGAPLFDEAGDAILGHIGAFSVNPMPDTEPFRQLFQLFASRAGAELRRLNLEKELRARTDELDAVVQSAMDAILILDEEHDIVRANRAAEVAFASAELAGNLVDRFFSVQGAEKLESILQTLRDEAGSAAQVWIPGGLEGRTADGRKFAAEGTLSRFSLRGRNYYTLILRSVEDRLAAEQKIAVLSEQAAYLQEEIEHHFGEIVGESPAMKKILQEIREVAGTDASVLISGETGTGKELVARAVHRASRRAAGPLIKVNCAAIPSQLMESEFFGHEKGAFTGATARREGRFALANGGTIFLDEIGELPLELQPKLLRVLQEGEFEPVGGTRTRKVDVRVIAATNRDLRAEAEAGRFREDLYYRISVFPIHVPALRHRDGDVELLARTFIHRFSEREGRKSPPPDPQDLERLREYTWPGNVRELANVIERALISGNGSALNLARAMPAAPSSALPASPSTEDTRVFTDQEMRQLEIENIRRALLRTGGRVSGPNGAATLIGVRPTTLSSRIKALGIRGEA